MPQIETVDYVLNTIAGELTFETPPAVDAQVTAGFEFNVPVRFDTDLIQISVSSFQAGEVPSVPVIEVKV